MPYRLAAGDLRGEMQDTIEPGTGGEHRGDVMDADLCQGDPCGQRIGVAGRQVVRDCHVMPGGGQLCHHHAADVACAPGDQQPHVPSSGCAASRVACLGGFGVREPMAGRMTTL